MDFTPHSLDRTALRNGRFELVEWRWPSMIDFVKTESELMVEMSLPPHATDASAEFPEIDSGNHCFMGTLFVRYPGMAVHGRGSGGRIRLLRCVFSANEAGTILQAGENPPLEVLQGLLDIRSDTLRTLMSLTLRELTAPGLGSADALDAFHHLIATEVRRHFARQAHGSHAGRLAAWQFRRIRDRLSRDEQPPSNADLAALCGLSVRHLNRQFQALTGNSLGDYIESHQMERARNMLCGGDLPIKTIAAQLGYSHANSFARAFRRVSGTTPLTYRQRTAASVPKSLR
ncbi:helix-turn-helix domain-containing protein [Novosphingobium sp. P6W]|uniref:helix-turn-helix domain-containing protein n=1 Tax=Novosphingobium sp. P6W TaxID=1609758 RepID=UPI000697EC6D|nr:AraC family transcriptional regulator [Novosphingobium sp. P6W]AXB80320.1 AraC family transcriptional regulator [Novosphingobium sp. P6W]